MRRMDGPVCGSGCDGENTVPPFGRVVKNIISQHTSKLVYCNSKRQTLLFQFWNNSVEFIFVTVHLIFKINIILY